MNSPATIRCSLDDAEDLKLQRAVKDSVGPQVGSKLLNIHDAI